MSRNQWWSTNRWVFMLLCGMGAVPVAAQTVRYEDGFAQGIRNLRVDNQCYDVDFVTGSYLEAYGRAAPTFLNAPLMASAAADEIRDVLNGQRGVPEINASNSEVLWVPNQRVSRSRFRAAQVGHDESSSPWRRYADFEGQVDHDWEAWDFAVFTEGPQVVYAANTGHAVGIHNLNLDGMCLDVRFAAGSYLEVYGKQDPRYLNRELRANHAANRIMAVLNAETTVPEINDSPNEVLWIPTDRSRLAFQAEQVGHNASVLPWQRFGDFSGAVGTDYAAWDFAVFEESLDCNRDGVVDVQDMNCSCAPGLAESVLEAIGSLPGDLNVNGTVGFADFLTLSENFGEQGDYTDGDLNCDRQIDFADFLIFSQYFGQSGSAPLGKLAVATAVPEPSGTGVLWCLALPALLVRCRRRRV